MYMQNELKIDRLLDLSHTIAAGLFDGLTWPGEALSSIKGYILALGKTLDPERFDHPAEDIWIARDAMIAPTALLNGPLIVDAGAEIRHCAFVRGSAIVGKGAVVGNSVELKNCVLFDGVQVPHFNYVGDSILGWKAHMGAGSVTSNVKSDKRNVVIHAQEYIETGLRKLGAVLGDRAEIGCNSVLNPGTVVGRDCIVYPTSCVRGVIPEGHIYKGASGIVTRRKD